MDRLARRLLFVCILAVAPAPALAEAFSAGPLGPYLLLGSEGIWQGALHGESYALTNASDANSTNSLFVDPRGGGGKTRWDISVEVRLEEDRPGGMAGLLYGRQQEDPPFYLALVIDTRGQASILQRNRGGLERLAVFDKAQVIKGAFNTLRIVEGVGQFEVFINGTRVGTARTDVSGTGAVGIFAGGMGRFLFRNFALTPVPGAAPPAATAEPAEKAATTAAEAVLASVKTAGAAAATAPAASSAGGAQDAIPSLDDIGYSSDSPLLAKKIARRMPLVTLPLPPRRPAEFGG